MSHLDTAENTHQHPAMASDRLQTARLLIRTGRFPFLAAGFLLYLTGALFAVRTGTPFSLFSFLAGYLVCGSAHLSVSYSNDYFDRHTDDPSKRTAFSGGSGILVEHPGLAPAALACAVPAYARFPDNNGPSHRSVGLLRRSSSSLSGPVSFSGGHIPRPPFVLSTGDSGNSRPWQHLVFSFPAQGTCSWQGASTPPFSRWSSRCSSWACSSS